MASDLGLTINKILDLCRAHPQVANSVFCVKHVVGASQGEKSSSKEQLVRITDNGKLERTHCIAVGLEGTLPSTFNRLLPMWDVSLQGLPQKVLDEEVQSVDVEVLKKAINYLLQKVPCEHPPSLI